MITLEILSENAKSRINVEGAELSSIDIRETTATVVQQPYGETNVIWFEGQKYIIVTASDVELAIKIAESVKFMNN